MNLCLLPLILAFALYYSSYHHFGVTVLRKNFINNDITLESIVYGLVIGLRFATRCMWLEAMFRVVSSDKVVYLFGKISPLLSLFLTILLRLIPRIGLETRRINLAQKGIGRGSNQGTVFQRFVNCLRIFSMLITWMISALALESDSMRSRGSLLRGRTAFSIYRFDNRGPRLCDWAVCLHHPDGHGRNPWGKQDVVQSKDCLAAIERDWRGGGYWISSFVPDAYGAGDLDGVSV